MRSSAASVEVLAFTLGVVTLATAALVVVRSRRHLYRCLAHKAAHTPPKLPKRPHMVPFGYVENGATDDPINRGTHPMDPPVFLQDDYFYVRDETRQNATILHHLQQENAFAEVQLAHLRKVRQRMYQELLSHVQETDESYPDSYGEFLYYTRTIKGQSYRLHFRKRKTKSPESEQAQEEVLLDENELAQNHSHCSVVHVRVSPDHQLLAYLVDYTGNELFTLCIKDLATGQLVVGGERTGGAEVTSHLENVAGLTWGQDASEIFYSTQDPVTHRCDKVWRRQVDARYGATTHKQTRAQEEEEDELVYQEPDECYDVNVWRSRSNRFLLMSSESADTTEVSFLDFAHRERGVQCVQPRIDGLLYFVGHHEDLFLIVTNKDNATNNKLMYTLVDGPVGTAGRDADAGAKTAPDVTATTWKDVFAYDPSIKVTSIDCFKRFVMMSGRQDGQTQLWLLKPTSASSNECRFDKQLLEWHEPLFTVDTWINRDYDVDQCRVSYCSMTTPRTLYDYDVHSGVKTLLREWPVPNYDRNLYASERLFATASDGTQIPMSMLYRKDLRNTAKPQPLHLYGYGSYEACEDPYVSIRSLPLLDRGVIFVIAHIRGGGELGRNWYESAKYLTKKTTFTDFVSCAEHLVAQGITRNDLMSCEGASAGGLLVGAVLNMRPGLFTAAIADVPFVDVMNTISDASLPLTTYEWKEWGNPNEAKYFHYMLSYSPYENVKRQAYPSLLVASGLHDPRVSYWEPTKWVARLRELKTDHNDVLLITDMTSGHSGASDRYKYLHEEALKLAFLLDQLHALNAEDWTLDVGETHLERDRHGEHR